MTEHLTGYAYAQPIKSKEAKEVAKVLWSFVSIFGPIRTLLSDNGGENLNKIIDEFLKLIGTERRVTSAYHPEANGKNERLNQTLCRALRKHVEDDQLNWDLYLSFVTFAYNTRIHSVTGVAPYTGIFGICCNHFDDYDSQSTTKIENINNLIRIKKLFESTHETIKKNRHEFQIKQKKFKTPTIQLPSNLSVLTITLPSSQ